MKFIHTALLEMEKNQNKSLDVKACLGGAYSREALIKKINKKR